MRQLLLYIILACGATVAAQTTTTIKLTQLETSPVIESSRAGQVGLTNSDGKQRYAQFVEVDLNPIGFVPTATGNTQNYSEFVTDPNGDKWYIDWQGRGYKFPGSAVDKNGYYGGNGGNGGNGTIPSSTTSTLTNQLTFLIDTSALTGTVPIRIKVNKPGDFEDFMSMVSGSSDSLFFYRSDANFVIRYTSGGDFALVADSKLMLQGDSIQMVGVGTHTGGGSIFLKQTAGGTVKKQIGINQSDLNFSSVLDINAGTNVTVTDTNGVYTISATGGGGSTYYPGSGITITGDTITAVDISNTNEGELSVSSGGLGVTVRSNTNNYASSFRLVDGAGIYISNIGNSINFENTGDLDVTNEGVLGVAAGASNTSVITSNTESTTGVTLSGGTGIAVTETTSTNGGTVTITNSAPDQTVTLANGGGIAVSGTYPGFTLTATDQSVSNEGTLGVSAGGANTSVISSNTAGASGVTVSGGTGIAVTETTSSNGGTVTITNNAPDQTVTLANGGGIAVSGTYPGFTLTATDQSITNELQTIDTFSLSGQSLRASLSSDNQPAKVVTLPVVGINAGTNVTVSESSGVYTINASGGGAPSGSAGGDLSGTYPNPTVAKIQGVSVSTTAPTNGQVLSYSTVSSSYVPASVSATPAGSSGEIQLNNSGVFGSIPTLFVDISTNRLGLGNNNPQARLHVTGLGSLTAKSLLIQNNASPNRSLLDISDNGQFLIGTNANALATAPTAAIGVVTTETNAGIALVPKGTGAITAQIPDGTTTAGNARGANSVDLQMSRASALAVASGTASVIVGGNSNRATGNYSVSVGGDGNNVSGANGVAVGGGSNAISNTYSGVLCGFDNSISGAESCILGGRANIASALRSAVLGGRNNSAVAEVSSAFNSYSRAYLYGQMAIGSGAFGSGNGDAQTSNVRARREITGTAINELTLDGGTPAAGNRIILNLPTGATNGRIWNAVIQLSAICTTAGGTVTAGEAFIGSYNCSIKRTSGGTALVGTVQNLITPQADANMSSSVVTISADTANNSLKIEFTPPTGANASTVIRVVATVYLTEVGY